MESKITGCTVHFVDEFLDSGPIVLQSAVPVLDQDTVESLSARILFAGAYDLSEGYSMDCRGARSHRRPEG